MKRVTLSILMAMIMVAAGVMLGYADTIMGNLTWGGKTYQAGGGVDGNYLKRGCQTTYDNVSMANHDNVTLGACRIPAKAIITRVVVNVLTKFSSSDNNTNVSLSIDGNRLTFTGNDNISVGWVAGLRDGMPSDNSTTWVKTTNEALPVLMIKYNDAALKYGKANIWIDYLQGR